MLLHTPEDFLKDIGHFSDWDQKKHGTERTFTNQTVCGITLLVWWWLISEKADTLYSEDQVRWPEGLWKAEEETRRYTTRVIQRQQSCCFASLFPSISSVTTEHYRIGVKNLLSRFQILIQPVAELNDESESEVAPTVVSILTTFDQCSSTGKLVASTHSSE